MFVTLRTIFLVELFCILLIMSFETLSGEMSFSNFSSSFLHFHPTLLMRKLIYHQLSLNNYVPLKFSDAFATGSLLVIENTHSQDINLQKVVLH